MSDVTISGRCLACNEYSGIWTLCQKCFTEESERQLATLRDQLAERDAEIERLNQHAEDGRVWSDHACATLKDHKAQLAERDADIDKLKDALDECRISLTAVVGHMFPYQPEMHADCKKTLDLVRRVREGRG